MSSITSRIARLEAIQPPRRVIVVYEHETTPEDLLRLQTDDSITLVVVCYVEGDPFKPKEEQKADGSI